MQNKTKNSDFQKISRKKDTRFPLKTEWILAAVAMLILLPCFFYSDIIVTTRHALNFWECMTDGCSLRNFYFYNSIKSNTSVFSFIPAQGAAYPILVYFIFALWDIPLFLSEHFGGIDVFSSPITVLYAKLILIIFLFLCAVQIKKICIQLKLSEQKADWAAYLFCTSAVVFMSVILIGQYDLFSIYFTLLGFSAYLRNDKLSFVGWFSLAFMCKFFALLIFVPLLFLDCKKILKNIFETIIAFMPTLILNIIFPAYVEKGGHSLQSSLITYWFADFNGNFAFGNIRISLLAVSFIALFFYTFYLDPDDIYTRNLYAVYISAFSYMSFILFAICNAYWSMLLIPFTTLLIVLNKKNYKLNILLDTLGFGSYFMTSMCKMNNDYYYDQYIFRPTFFKKIIDFSEIPYGIVFSGSERNGTEWYVWSFIQILGNKIGIENFLFIFLLVLYSLFFTSMIALMIINHPKRLLRINNNNSSDDICRGLIHFRTTVNIILTSLPIAAILYSAKNVYHCL